MRKKSGLRSGLISQQMVRWLTRSACTYLRASTAERQCSCGMRTRNSIDPSRERLMEESGDAGEDTLPKQGKSGSTIHCTLDELQPVNLALYDALTVGQDQAREHRFVILPESSPKTHQFGDVTASCSFDPRVQPLGVVVVEEGSC